MKNAELNITVLYAEDKEDTRKNISEILGRRVKKLFIAKDGKEAFGLYKKHKPDLVLSDIKMPEMNGLELVEKIKQLNPQIKVIMMSAFTDSDYLLKSIDIQIDGYIIKPVHKSKLLSAIKKQADIIILEKEAKRHEETLTKSEEKYRMLFDMLPFGGEIINTNGIITNCSKSTAQMLGYNISDIVGSHVTSFLDAETISNFKINFPKLLKGNSVSKEAIMIHKNGEEINVLRLAQPITDNTGKVESILALSVDITKRKTAEESIKQQNIELKERNEELDAYSHTVAHDLKSPLGTMMGFANLIYDDYTTISKDKIEYYLSIIIKSGNKTQEIINSLLLFASVRKEDAKIDEFNMGFVVGEAINHYKSKILKTKATVTLPEFWPAILGNPIWIEEVWVNYISNALKYGGNPPKIEIGWENELNQKNKTIRFWIRDNGNGISKENQNLIFQNFERLDKTNIVGHGLGLSIVKRIIEKLGGEVGVESIEGEGSIFYFTLPTNQKHQTSKLKSEPSNIKQETTNTKHKIPQLKILIAEDESTSDSLLTALIRNISKETLHATTGKETIDIYRKNQDIDLILMDIKMPILNGYEATKQIREINKDVIIIAQTAYALSSDHEKAIESGCNDYISKPIDKDKLLEMIKEHF